MATGVQVWSPTPAANATSDSNINWAEGMAPSAVDDSARSMMASVAKWNNDNNGTLVTSGSSTALTLVTNQVEGSLVSGYTVAFQFGTNVSSAATLAVDGLAASPLQAYNGSALLGGEWKAGDYGCFTYSTTGTGQWIWKGTDPTPTAVNRAVGEQTNAGPAATATVSPGVMWGFNFPFTPVRSSRIFAQLNATGVNNSSLGGMIVSLRFGTGAAPVGGAAPAGTIVGLAQSSNNVTANAQMPVTTAGVVTGLTPGTAIWLDICYGTLGSGTISLSNAAIAVFEI